jgi:hypothetical protein
VTSFSPEMREDLPLGVRGLMLIDLGALVG